ncbi:MAG: oligosaccharide flippase family protein, partial [Chitinophagaceae bacterium]
MSATPSVKSTFWAKSLFFTLMQRFSLFFFGLGSFFILTHNFLTKEEVGIYALFQTTLGLLEYLKMGLLRNALIKLKFDEGYINRSDEVYSASLIINFAYSAVVIVFLLFFSGWISSLLKTPELKDLLHLSIGIVIFQIPFSHCEILQQSVMTYQKTFYAYCIRQGLVFAFIASALFNRSIVINNNSLVIAQIVAIGTASVYYLFVSGRMLSRKLEVNMHLIWKLLQFGRYVFGTALLSYLYKFADHFVTAYVIGDPFRGKIYVSYYNVVSRVSNVLDVPFMAVADVLFPKNAHALATEGTTKVKYYFERMVGILTALIIPVSICICFLPGFVIRLIAGPAYLPAVPILQITMAFAFLRPFYGQFGFT